MRQLCVIVLACAITASVGAQSRQEQAVLPTPPQRFDRPIRFENLSLEDGLPQGSVYAIRQDSQGFMWFGTQTGISRYDGYGFKNFKHIPFDSSSAETSWIYDIEEAPDGSFWLASTYRGISRMDPATEKFTHYRNDPRDSTSLSAGWVNAVHLDTRGILWIGIARGGLNRMDTRNPGRFERYVHDADDPSSLSSNDVYFITEDKTGALWISTGNGLNRMQTDRPGHFDRYLVGSDKAPRSADLNARIGDVYSRDEEPEWLWVATEAALKKLNVSTGETRTVFPHTIFQMTRDPENSDVLWLTTTHEGLVRFDMGSEEGVRFRSDPRDATSLAGDHTVSIFTDRSGTIWVGTNTEGISKFNPSAINFAHIREGEAGDSGLPEASAWGLLVDSKGGLWVAGTDRGALQRMDVRSGRVQVWQPDFSRPPDANGPAGRSFTFAEDQAGGIWIATNRGLNRYNPATRRFEVYVSDPGDESSLSADNISALHIDRKGGLWVGTRGNGVNRLDAATGKFTRYRFDSSDSSAVAGGFIMSILEDASGTMWFGGSEGVSQMDPETGRSTHHAHDPKNAAGLTNGNVTWIHERSREPGVLWLTTSGGGLDRFDKRTGTFTHYTEQNSNLANNHIYAILEDEAGRLWMSTNRGISRFDPETSQFSNFGIEHGLQSLEFNQWSAAMAPDGQMYFGGVNGINSFYPDAVGTNDMAPPIALTDLRLFNNPVAPGPGSPLQQTLSRTHEIRLSYDQARNVGFDFVALHFKNSAKNRYAYQLEGFDGDWIQSGAQRSATYTNLPPGSYTFRVKAANSDGIWNDEGATLQLVVLPPWWRTNWAYVLYGLLLVGAVVATDRFQRRRLRKKSQFEQAQLRAQAAESETEAAKARAMALQADNERKKNAELLSEIGKEITSTLDLETIFDRLYEHVNNLLEAPVFGVGLYHQEREQLDYRLAMENGVRYAPYSRDTSDKNQFPVWCIENRAPVFINDVEEEYSRYIESYHHAGGRLEDGTVAQEPQSLMYLPLISKERVLGVVSVQSFSKGAYTEHDLNILQALATYTAIAVDNADAYRRLNATFDHLREAQQQLVQQEKLASLGQLTAGIAHEIKNPLNFVTNFSALNEELTTELEETLRACKAHLPEEKYREMEDLMTSLRVNSGHVAKHGRRADSIVKSMMEHASGGQGERYPVEVNAFLDEYVNLAYHGRRAQSPGFQVTLERHFGDEVGSVEMAPQELGRVVLNLLTNAFDAVTERAGASNGEFTPQVAVRTHRNDGHVEIRVEDNGTGIPKEIRERIFEPFFTTKPTGSGTGLGLSLSYDIVTQGHGGKLVVTSEEGRGTVFTVTLPVKA